MHANAGSAGDHEPYQLTNGALVLEHGVVKIHIGGCLGKIGILKSLSNIWGQIHGKRDRLEQRPSMSLEAFGNVGGAVDGDKIARLIETNSIIEGEEI